MNANILTHQSTESGKPKIALVHDYLREYGGAERVLEALHQLYPEAPVYVGFIDRARLGIHAIRFASWDIRETWIRHLLFYKQLYSPYRIFAPKAFSSLDLSAFDIVISSSNAYFAKSIVVPNGKHLCYCHTPPRALYGYTTMSNWKANPFTRVIGQVMNHFLRIVDYYAAQKVDVFVANSKETQRRITKFYRRDSVVIHPPVTMVDWVQENRPKIAESTDRTYYLYVNRLALAKHPELAVQACTQLGLPLQVVGDGAMLSGLKDMAGPTIAFLGQVDDAQLRQLYAHAKAVIYPVEDEDFGIVPIEAMAFGTSVIAHRSGGPVETVAHQKSGWLFDDLSLPGLTQAITQSSRNWDHPAIAQSAEQYSLQHFMLAIQHVVKQHYQ